MEYLTVEEVMMIHRAEIGLTHPIVTAGVCNHAPPAVSRGPGRVSDLHFKAAALMHSLAPNHPFVDGEQAHRRSCHTHVLSDQLGFTRFDGHVDYAASSTAMSSPMSLLS